MDWTNFEGYPFHYRRADVDLRRELMRSLKATAVFLAVLAIAAIIIATRISHGLAGAMLEPMSVAVCID